MDTRHITDRQQVLADMARGGPQNRQESSTIVSPGGGGSTWAIQVKSHVARNVYRVCVVTLGETGSPPVEVGEPMEAVNLAESFLTEGTLAAGTYAILHRLGEVNVFHVAP
jgi:hypothetical protein